MRKTPVLAPRLSAPRNGGPPDGPPVPATQALDHEMALSRRRASAPSPRRLEHGPAPERLCGARQGGPPRIMREKFRRDCPWGNNRDYLRLVERMPVADG